MNFLENPTLDFEFIDLESSGLGNESYPIEIGFTFKEHTFSFLIKPDSSWTYWDSLAEELYHGISREDLNKNGLDIKEICLLVNSYLSGLVLYSDGFNFDRFWVEKLFSTAKVEMMFKIRDIRELTAKYGVSDYKFFEYKEIISDNTKLHRAGYDANLNKLTFEAIIKQL